MAHRGSPGIHAGRPTPQNLLSASRRGGQIKSTAHRGGRPAGLFGSRVLRNLCRYSVAGQALFVGASLLANDLREQARSHSCSVPVVACGSDRRWLNPLVLALAPDAAGCNTTLVAGSGRGHGAGVRHSGRSAPLAERSGRMLILLANCEAITQTFL